MAQYLPDWTKRYYGAYREGEWLPGDLDLFSNALMSHFITEANYIAAVWFARHGAVEDPKFYKESWEDLVAYGHEFSELKGHIETHQEGVEEYVKRWIEIDTEAAGVLTKSLRAELVNLLVVNERYSSGKANQSVDSIFSVAMGFVPDEHYYRAIRAIHGGQEYVDRLLRKAKHGWYIIQERKGMSRIRDKLMGANATSIANAMVSLFVVKKTHKRRQEILDYWKQHVSCLFKFFDTMMKITDQDEMETALEREKKRCKESVKLLGRKLAKYTGIGQKMGEAQCVLAAFV